MNKVLYIGQGIGHTDFTINIRNGFEKAKAAEYFEADDAEWVPLNNNSDTLYFLPGCTVPRFKVREHYRCTNKPENATAIFIPEKYELPTEENSRIEVVRTLKMSVADFTQYIMNNYGVENKNYKKIKMLTVANNWTNLYVTKEFLLNNYYEKPHDYDKINGQTASGFDTILSESRWSLQSDRSDNCKTMCFIPLNSPLNNYSGSYYFETQILKHLNKDSLIIDETKFNELMTIGESDDDENIVLMMELMANSNYEKSYVYLLMLLKAFGDKMAYQKVINHVNFKGLLKYFSLERKDIGNIDLVKLTKALKSAKKFTRSNVQIITSLCSGDYIRYDAKEINGLYTEGPVLRPEVIEFNGV